MFLWNYGALKNTETVLRNVEDPAIYDLLSQASFLFNNNMNSVLSLLKIEVLMNKDQVCNPEKQVPMGIELNEKDYMNCLLTSLKEMAKNYTIAVTEASNYIINIRISLIILLIYKEKHMN